MNKHDLRNQFCSHKGISLGDLEISGKYNSEYIFFLEGMISGITGPTVNSIFQIKKGDQVWIKPYCEFKVILFKRRFFSAGLLPRIAGTIAGRPGIVYDIEDEDRQNYFHFKICSQEEVYTLPIEVIDFENGLITSDWLMKQHPEISKDQSIQLLKFCNDRMICLKMCYGDGSILFPKWKQQNI